MRCRETQGREMLQKPGEDSVSRRREGAPRPTLPNVPEDRDGDLTAGFSNPEVLAILTSTIQVSNGGRVQWVQERVREEGSVTANPRTSCRSCAIKGS